MKLKISEPSDYDYKHATTAAQGHTCTHTDTHMHKHVDHSSNIVQYFHRVLVFMVACTARKVQSCFFIIYINILHYYNSDEPECDFEKGFMFFFH